MVYRGVRTSASIYQASLCPRPFFFHLLPLSRVISFITTPVSLQVNPQAPALAFTSPRNRLHFELEPSHVVVPQLLKLSVSKPKLMILRGSHWLRRLSPPPTISAVSRSFHARKPGPVWSVGST